MPAAGNREEVVQVGTVCHLPVSVPRGWGRTASARIASFLYPDDRPEEIEGSRDGKIERSPHPPPLGQQCWIPALERVVVVRVGEGSPKPWASTRQVGSTHTSAKGLETALMPLL